MYLWCEMNKGDVDNIIGSPQFLMIQNGIDDHIDLIANSGKVGKKIQGIIGEKWIHCLDKILHMYMIENERMFVIQCLFFFVVRRVEVEWSWTYELDHIKCSLTIEEWCII